MVSTIWCIFFSVRRSFLSISRSLRASDSESMYLAKNSGTRNKKKKRKKQHVSRGACDYTDMMEVIDERWRLEFHDQYFREKHGAAVPRRPLSLARAGFSRVCIYDLPISDLFGRESKGTAVVGESRGDFAGSLRFNA